MNQLVQPADRLIKVYKRTLDSLFIFDPVKLRKPSKADEEIILWMAVMQYGHDATCYREPGKPLREVDWTLRERE